VEGHLANMKTGKIAKTQLFKDFIRIGSQKMSLHPKDYQID